VGNGRQKGYKAAPTPPAQLTLYVNYC